MSNRVRTPAQRRTAADSNSLFSGGNPNTSRKSKHGSNSHAGDHYGGEDSRSKLNVSDSNDPTAHSSLIQPRVAVVLGVSEGWHPPLFACRLLSIAPAVFWGVPQGLRVLAMAHLMFFGRANFQTNNTPEASPGTPPSTTGLDTTFEARLRLTETFLATLWCGASGYLSFFFTDCLMSRWLVNYTPQATIVRLLTIAAINIYLTSWALSAFGGLADPRLLLPVWIFISTTLTAMYHVTQRKINIRKETSMSISVFSIASFVSMVALLAQLHSNRTDYPQIPIAAMAKKVWQGAGDAAVKIMEYTGNTGDIL
ncbi:N-glycosylation protein-domain-containing protein [Podospora aff. communis PSN243]|uniref:N-glycosylation protein-domain-containing protein n=1 Tax=Podospora aff. communis PSN243 TaxID=3040156 RepID=A0AAV9GYT2_9PEZI|nr:N-glycosylation protein-domain-containing protein [Podospora aff. communis PSN243]